MIDLDIGGMTCAACAARIQRKLNQVDGVSATVNYALEVAHIDAPEGTDPATLVAVIERAGYTAQRRTSHRSHQPGTTSGWRVALVTALAGPVVAYMGVISAMVASAIGVGHVMGVIGAGLFYVSDALIAWNRFVRETRHHAVAIMVTYHLGQMALVLSLV